MAIETQDIEAEIIKILEDQTGHQDAVEICEIIESVMISKSAGEFVKLLQKWLATQ